MRVTTWSREGRAIGLLGDLRPTGHDAGGVMGGDQCLDLAGTACFGRTRNEIKARGFDDRPLDLDARPGVIGQYDATSQTR